MDKISPIELPLGKKVELIHFIQKGESRRAAARKFRISKSTASNIYKRRDEILSQYEKDCDFDHSRKIRKTDNEDINTAVWIWFQRLRSINVPINGPMVQAAALEFDSIFSQADPTRISFFQASEGWLRCFKKRHNIKFKSLSGEAFDAPIELAEEYKQKLPNFCEGFNKEDIFNADETALHFRALPTKSFCLPTDKCKGLKDQKDRVTVLLAVSQCGEWIKPLVIGKSYRPRAFRNLNISELPATWKANKSAWMTSEIFIEWLQNLNSLMTSKNRRILLFIDNCAAHKHIQLSNVVVKFFPANTTSLLQPLDQGIIQNFKTIYRKHFLKKVITSTMTCKSATEIVKSVTVLDAVLMISKAISEIKEVTVINCFAKAGFSEFQENLETDNSESTKLKELLDEFDEGVPEEIYTNFENSIQTSANIKIESIVEEIALEVQEIKEEKSISESEKGEFAEEISKMKIPSHQEAYEMILSLKLYAEEHGNQKLLSSIFSFECEYTSIIAEVHRKSKQMEITDYFSVV